MNEDFEKSIFLELYNWELHDGNLAFYAYVLSTKKFRKIFTIPNDPEKKFWYSYNKIDRNATKKQRRLGRDAVPLQELSWSIHLRFVLHRHAEEESA